MPAINTQISNNASANLNKSDLKLDNKELKDAKTSQGTKDAKELTSSLKNNLGLNNAPKELASATTFDNTQLNLKLKELVNKFLDQIASKNDKTPNMLKQGGEKLNFALNFGNELKALGTEMSKSDVFKEVLQKLEQILKPAAQVKSSADLAPLLKNSGVFLESKLKDALTPEALPKSFHSLISAIKAVSSPKLANEIIALAAKELDPKSTLDELKNLLKTHQNENKEILKNSGFKALLELNSKLENLKTYISKNPSLAQEKITQLASKMLDHLNKLEKNFKQELSKPENLMLKDTKIIADINKGFEKLKNTLENILNPNKKPNLNAQNTQNVTPNKTPNLNSAPKNEDVDTNAPSQKSERGTQKTDENVKFNSNSKNEIVDEKPGTNSTNHANKENVNLNNAKESVKTENAQENLQTDKANTSSSQESKSNSNTQAKMDENAQQTSDKQSQNTDPQSKIETEKQGTNSANKENLNSNNTKENAKNSTLNTQEKPQSTQSAQTQNSEAGKQSTNQAKEASQDSMSKNQNAPQTPNNQSSKELLNSIFTETKPSANAVKNLIFSTPDAEFNELENLNKDLVSLNKKLIQGLKELDLNSTEARTNLNDIKSLSHKLEKAMKDIANIAPKSEAAVAQDIKNDIKSTLLQISNLAKDSGNESVANAANRLLTQIELNQLMSLANDSIHTSLPLEWQDLEDSRVVFKRGKKDKYFAQIKLNFKNLGALDVLLALNHDKYIDINIMAENKAFRKRIYENAHELKRGLHKAGLLNSNFFVGDIVRSKFDEDLTQARDYDYEMGIDKKA